MPIISVATKKDPGLNFFLASCQINGITPTILGMNDPRPMNHTTYGMGLKLMIIQEYLEKNPQAYRDDEIILVCDAFDVIVVEKWDFLENRYKSLNTEILVSVEKNCHPDKKMAPLFDALAPDKPWRYINTGSFMLPFGTLKKLINYKPFDAKKDDQLWFQEIFFDTARPFQITLDYDCFLFQTVFQSFDEVSANLNGRWHNKTTGTSPSIIHGAAMPINMLAHMFQMTFPLVSFNPIKS